MKPAEAAELVSIYRANPEHWAEEWLGVELWDHQIRALCSWRDNRNTSWRSCNGAGKTMVDAVGVLWLGSCWENTSILTTATTFTQLKGSVWGEVEHLIRNARRPLGCEALTTEVRWPHGSRAFAVTAPSTDKHKAKMAGYRAHGRDARTFVLGDEASGLSASILEGIRGMLTGAEAHKLLTGNPLDPTTEFKRTFDQESVEKIKTSAFDTPNFTAFGITLDDIMKRTWRAKVTGPWPNPALITPMVAEEFLESCGGDIRDPTFVARILAEFPEASPNTVIPSHWIEAAFTLGALPRQPDEPTRPCRLGTDVARFGDDSSVNARLRGVRCKVVSRIHGHDTMQVAGNAALDAKAEQANEIRVDTIGVGAGVHDRLKELGLPVVDVNVSSSPMDPTQFVNLRSEAWWGVRERFEATYKALMGEKDMHGVAIKPGILLEERDEMLASELNAPRWAPDSRGRRVVEPKDETKKRLGRSPDRADAVMLACVTLGSSIAEVKFNLDTHYIGPQWRG